ESDPEEDPEEYEDDVTKDSPVDHPMDGRDDGDDDDGNSSGYDADDEDMDEEEEEEHLALADSAVVKPTDENVSPLEGTEPIIPPPSTDTATTGARITIRPQTSISLPPKTEVERLLAMPTPSPSPLTLLSPPLAGEHLARCTAPAALPSPPLPPSLYPPLPVDRRDDIPESEQPPRKRLCLSTQGSRYKVGESSIRGRGVEYGFADAVEAEMRHQVETLRVMRDMRREMGDMQAELLALRGQLRRAGQPRGDARVPNHQDVPRDADSSRYKVGESSTRGRGVEYGFADAVEAEMRHQGIREVGMTLQETVWIVVEEAYAAREAWAHSVGLSQTVHH
nr:hypothetical protein [Tanacetum cinerariifolium]